MATGPAAVRLPAVVCSNIKNVLGAGGDIDVCDRYADAETLTRLAVCADTPPALLAHLAVCAVPAARAAVAARTDCPSDTLKDLESDPSPLVHAALLVNAACPPRLAERCVEHPDPLVRCHAAGDGSRFLQRLSVDTSPAVRRCVVSNPACPASLVETAAADRDPGVRSAAAAVAEDRRLLVRLCGDRDAAVRDVAALSLMDGVWDSMSACMSGLGRYLRFGARQVWAGDDGRLRNVKQRVRPGSGRHGAVRR